MTQPPSPQEVTELLVAWSGGDRTALDQLVPLVYDELRRLAYGYLRRKRGGHTLQTTALGRPECGGDGRGIESLARDGHARVAISQSVAPSGVGQRRR